VVIIRYGKGWLQKCSRRTMQALHEIFPRQPSHPNLTESHPDSTLGIGNEASTTNKDLSLSPAVKFNENQRLSFRFEAEAPS
jgi:hypothetical protein